MTGQTDISNLSIARKQLFAGNFQAAHAAAQQALKDDPQAVEAVLVMAAIAVEHGNGPGAEKLCSIAAQTGHRSCWLAVLEARVALMQQDQERARERALVAFELGTDDPHIANQLGVALSRTGRHAEAVQPFRTAVAGAAGNADYRYNLAVALQFSGDLADAEREFHALVAMQPDHAKGWGALVQLAHEPEPGWDAALSQLFDDSKDVESRLTIGHALARLAEERQDWDTSLKWLDRAKAPKAAEVAHDRSAAEAIADAAIAAGGAGSFADIPSGDERPIFIVGMPRSGTTLVERILTSHPNVRSVGELSDFAILLKQELRTPGQLVLEPALLQAASTAPDLTAVGKAYLQRLSQLAGDTPHFIDKMPFNAFFTPAILRALPGARVICLRRSPFDVLFANYRQLFATGFSYYSYAYDFGDTAHFVAGFERMANAFEASLPPARFLPVRYEEVIADQRGQTERLLAFCGLEWDDACMEFHRNAEPVATASAVQVRSPIYTSSVEKWRRYGEGSERAIDELGKYGIEA
ncbi:tetratricopeptide repeat-containing sulfotransferase family protein [Parerythrobacter aestuarii]|uniref:tetratricopeptide repeat-containing sulfotransferase family protein n=1 Tax=Parerythrobacter aestuarii TaxID=3020909 RepID=UPI0024DE125F|nr:tetratricopeptide repeat-containing sulfotransferase family protein [Parerythrobacter aestuarii]